MSIAVVTTKDREDGCQQVSVELDGRTLFITLVSPMMSVVLPTWDEFKVRKPDLVVFDFMTKHFNDEYGDYLVPKPKKPELTPRLQTALNIAKALFKHGDEKPLSSAIDVVAKYSADGPFTPEELELLKAHT